MKTTKELDIYLENGDSDAYHVGKLDALKDVLELIDKRIKMLEEIMVNSKQVNKNEALMDTFKASVHELEELKKKITGNGVELGGDAQCQ